MGKFTLANLTPGTYDLTIEKPGWPSVKVYGVTVEANKTIELPLHMIKPGMPPPSETTPPTVSISCPSPATGQARVEVDASDASGIYGVLLSFDEQFVWGEFDPEEEELSLPTTVVCPTTSYSDGIYKITIMALDYRGNIGVKSIPVQIANGTTPGDLPNAPSDFIALMATLRYSTFTLPEFFFTGGTRSMKSEISSPRLFSLLRGFTPGTKGTPAGSESVIFCSLDFTYSGSEVTGFKIYRDGACIASGPSENCFDGSPVLCPGKAVAYKVSAYNAAGEGPATDPLARTPLGPLSDVTLTAPANGDNVPTSTPSFTWQPVSGAEGYFIVVLGYDDVMNWWEIIWLAYTRTQTQVTYGSPDVDSIIPAQALESGKTYKWYVVAGASTPDVPSDVNWDICLWPFLSKSLACRTGIWYNVFVEQMYGRRAGS